MNKKKSIVAGEKFCCRLLFAICAEMLLLTRL